MYTFLRYRLREKENDWDKLLVVAGLLDLLEKDFREVYPESGEPLPGGFEAALRRLFKERFGG